MEYRRLGRSGFMVSEPVLGTRNFGNPTLHEEAFRIIGLKAAMPAGANPIIERERRGGQRSKIAGVVLESVFKVSRPECYRQFTLKPKRRELL